MKTAPDRIPTWTPEKGNIFQWVLKMAQEKRASLPPVDPGIPFARRQLRKI